MNYTVLDLETANPDYASICQLGIIVVREGKVSEQASVLIDPQDYFDPWHVSLHGIDQSATEAAPTFQQYYDQLAEMLRDQIVVHHGPFDRVAITRACEQCELDQIAAIWLDNQKVVRRTWTEFSTSGYGLKKLAKHFAISFKHHDALEDARATEQVFRQALEVSRISPHEWLQRVTAPITPSSSASVKRIGNSDGPFAGESIVFTGALRVARAQAADEAQRAGFDVESSVNKRTTILCVGIQDRDKLAGYEKSSKHRKAEQMIAAGAELSIISEEDLWALIA